LEVESKANDVESKAEWWPEALSIVLDTTIK
jgi:hypothetical protein